MKRVCNTGPDSTEGVLELDKREMRVQFFIRENLAKTVALTDVRNTQSPNASNEKIIRKMSYPAFFIKAICRSGILPLLPKMRQDAASTMLMNNPG
ncbi:MAG: hypothetical protein IT426_03460 [Pirellulales bacterium]|nr:hypothetical protein [Pirellulales bacterium]